jgi:hypothetical protein
MENRPEKLTYHHGGGFVYYVLALFGIIAIVASCTIVGYYSGVRDTKATLKDHYDDGYTDGYGDGWEKGIADAKNATERVEFSIYPGLIEVLIENHPQGIRIGEFPGEPVQLNIRNRSSIAHTFKQEVEYPRYSGTIDLSWDSKGSISYESGNPNWLYVTPEVTVPALSVITCNNVLNVPSYVKDGRYMLYITVSVSEPQGTFIRYIAKVLITVDRD